MKDSPQDNRWKLAGYRQGYSECGLCQPPCATCKKCWPGDKNCFQAKDCPAGVDKEGAKLTNYSCDKAITDEPSAHFCSSCKQEKYYPPHWEDIQTKEDYVKNQAAMVFGDTKKAVVQQAAIKDKFGDLNVNDFLRSTIAQDGGDIEEEFPHYIGMQSPEGNLVDWVGQNKWTYLDLYKA